MALRDLPLLGRFSRGGNPPANTRSSTEFYDLLGKAESAEQTIKEYFVRDAKDDVADSGDLTDRALEIQEENGWLLGPQVFNPRAKGGFSYGGLQAMRKAQRKLSKLRQEADDVALSTTLTREEKRAKLDELTAERNALTAEWVRKLRAAEKAGTPSNATTVEYLKKRAK